MSEVSLFWEDGTGHGGPYSQDALRLLIRGIAEQTDDDQGVIGGAGNSLRPTTPGDNQVRIDTGSAVVDGVLYESNAVITMTAPTDFAVPASSSTGKRLVLRKTWSTQVVEAVILESTDGDPALPDLTQTDLTVWEIPILSFVHETSGAISSFLDERQFVNATSIQFQIDGGGTVIADGDRGPLTIPRKLHPYGWEMLADQAGTIDIDPRVAAYADYPANAGDSIAGGDVPGLAAAQKARNMNVASEGEWPLYIDPLTHMIANVANAATVERCTLTIYCAG